MPNIYEEQMLRAILTELQERTTKHEENPRITENRRVPSGDVGRVAPRVGDAD